MTCTKWGRIRFVGGPWHNRLVVVRPWVRAMILLGENTQYNLCTLHFGGRPFHEYVHESLSESDLITPADASDWWVDGYFIEPSFEPLQNEGHE